MRHSPVWQHLNGVREDDLLEHLEMKTAAFAKAHQLDPDEMAKALAGRRKQIAEKLKRDDPHLYALLQSHRGELDSMLKRMGADSKWQHRLKTLDQWRMRLKAFGHHIQHRDSEDSDQEHHTKERE
jgi:hypothetical protein